jgi:uncharacterized membrane protein
MENMQQFLQVIVHAISVLGTLVVCWGVIECVVSFVRLKLPGRGDNAVAASELVRQRLGAHLLLGLEIFIAADIITSVLSPSWEKLGILVAIVGVRTVLSYFLRIEVKQGIR